MYAEAKLLVHTTALASSHALQPFAAPYALQPYIAHLARATSLWCGVLNVLPLLMLYTPTLLILQRQHVCGAQERGCDNR